MDEVKVWWVAVLIRNATIGDLTEILRVRNHYILNSNALFESEPQKIEALADWFTSFGETGPHRIIACQDNNRLLGFACSRKYRDGEFFSQTVETSVYVDHSATGKGVGFKLYSELLNSLQNECIHSVVAGIALPNEASVALHKKVGFKEIGVFNEYAIKNGQFISSLWMQFLFPN